MLIKLGCGGINLNRLKVEAWIIIEMVTKAFIDEEPVITSTWEGTHLPWSKHYQGLAIDFRMPEKHDPDIIIPRLKDMLGPDYDVINERDHIHVEFDPKM